MNADELVMGKGVADGAALVAEKIADVLKNADYRVALALVVVWGVCSLVKIVVEKGYGLHTKYRDVEIDLRPSGNAG